MPIDTNYILFIESIDSFENENLKPQPSDFARFHQEIATAIKKLHNQGLIKTELPEFKYNENDFDGVFSSELKNIVEIEDFLSLEFKSVFAVKTPYPTIISYNIDFFPSFIERGHFKITTTDEFSKHISEEMLEDISSAFLYARDSWSKRASLTIGSSELDVYIIKSNTDIIPLERTLFGMSLFIHHTGKVLELIVKNQKLKFVDIGALYIEQIEENHEEDDGKKAFLENWVLEKYNQSPKEPPYNANDKEARANKNGFIEYAYVYFYKQKKNGEISFKVSRADIKRTWDKAIPNDSKWKLVGARTGQSTPKRK